MYRYLSFLFAIFIIELGVGSICAEDNLPTQITASEDVLWAEFLEYITADVDAAEEEEWLLSLEELETLRERKLDINDASVVDLLQIPFLDEAQIEQIHAYIYLHGPLQTLGELRMIPLLKSTTLRFLPLFVQLIPKSSLATSHLQSDGIQLAIKERMRGEMMYRMEMPFYYRKGYSVKNGYVGNVLKERLSANCERLTEKGKWSIALRTEKDAGEKFGDAWGGYVMWTNPRLGISQLSKFGIEKIVLGDFRVGYGEGLVVGMGAGVRPGSVYRRGGMGLRPMRGMDEMSFLRGAGISLFASQHWGVTVIGSCRQLDGTLDGDGAVRTLLSTGLHRTASERDRKGNVDRLDGALRVEWHAGNWKGGMTSLWEHYGRRLDPGTAVYRRWNMKGQDFLNTGLDYGWKKYRLSVSGETAYSNNHGGWGTLNKGEWIVSRRMTMSLLQRWYSYRYTSGLGGVVCQGSSPTNESGVLFRVEAEPWRRWEWVSYVDVFRNPWARYGVLHSSKGQDVMMQLTKQLGEHSTIHRVGIRYQLKRKESSSGFEPSHRFRLQWEWEPDGKWSLRSVAQLHESGGTGVSCGEVIRWEHGLRGRKGSLRVQGALSWFDTKDWACRLYQYEPSVSGSVSSVSLYGRGMRVAAVLRWRSSSDLWTIEGKYSLLKRWDADIIGSGLEEISSSRKGDAVLAVRMKL